MTKEQERVQVQQGRCKIRARPKEPDCTEWFEDAREESVHQGDGEKCALRVQDEYPCFDSNRYCRRRFLLKRYSHLKKKLI